MICLPEMEVELTRTAPRAQALHSTGGSPRATINLTLASKAAAFLAGRGYVTPQDVKSIAPDVLRHRLSLSYEALSDGLDADALIARIMAKIPAPARPLHHLQNSLGTHHEQQAA